MASGKATGRLHERDIPRDDDTALAMSLKSRENSVMRRLRLFPRRRPAEARPYAMDRSIVIERESTGWGNNNPVGCGSRHDILRTPVRRRKDPRMVAFIGHRTVPCGDPVHGAIPDEAAYGVPPSPGATPGEMIGTALFTIDSAQNRRTCRQQ